MPPSTSVAQIVDGDGAFAAAAAERVAERCGLAGAGVAYQTVAVVGPQSSGKSTLLNAMVRVERRGGGEGRRGGRR